MVAAGGRAACARWAAWCLFREPNLTPGFLIATLMREKSKKNQVWQHSYTRVRRPLIIARLTQRTPCPGIWSECRSYALLHEGSLPEVTGSSPIKFGDLPVLSTVIRPFFFVFWLRGRRGGKIRGGEHLQSTRSLEPTRGGARHRFHRQAAVVNKYGANEVVTCAKTAESDPFFANKLPLLAAAQTHHRRNRNGGVRRGKDRAGLCRRT